MGSDSAAEIDKVVGDDPEPDPAPHSIVAGISAPVEAMSSLAHTDAALAAGTSSLPAAQPALFFARACGRRFWWSDWECRHVRRVIAHPTLASG